MKSNIIQKLTFRFGKSLKNFRRKTFKTSSEMSKKGLKTCVFLCIFEQFWQFLPVYELVYCVGRPNTFCVVTPAFYRNMPTLPRARAVGH